MGKCILAMPSLGYIGRMSRGVDLSIEVGQTPSSPHSSVANVFGNLVLQRGAHGVPVDTCVLAAFAFSLENVFLHLLVVLQQVFEQTICFGKVFPILFWVSYTRFGESISPGRFGKPSCFGNVFPSGLKDVFLRASRPGLP